MVTFAIGSLTRLAGLQTDTPDRGSESAGPSPLAFQIAIGSSAQIALLVAPILVLTSRFYARPMDLLFHPFEIAALGLAVLNVAVVSLDGESNWFEGVQLIAFYLVLAFAFYFVPSG